MDGGSPRRRGRGCESPESTAVPRLFGESARSYPGGSTSAFGGTASFGGRGSDCEAVRASRHRRSCTAMTSPSPCPVQTLVDLATELDPIAARAGGQRRRQARPDRPRGAARRRPRRVSRRRARVSAHCAIFSTSSPSSLSDSDLEIYFRPIAKSRQLPSPLSKQRVNRFRSRLLLARTRAGRRDRRPPLPPHSLSPDARRATRPRPRHGRHDPAPLHPLRDPLRTAAASALHSAEPIEHAPKRLRL